MLGIQIVCQLTYPNYRNENNICQASRLVYKGCSQKKYFLKVKTMAEPPNISKYLSKLSLLLNLSYFFHYICLVQELKFILTNTMC